MSIVGTNNSETTDVETRDHAPIRPSHDTNLDILRLLNALSRCEVLAETLTPHIGSMVLVPF